MRTLNKIVLTLLTVFIVIQFIRPARNNSGQVLQTDVTNTIHVPGNVLDIFQKACYDCHSNNTRYPWYVNVQPVAWMLASHIKNGKENLNFSEFGSYSPRKQANKLRAIAKTMDEGSMPLSSYTTMHAEGKLSKQSKDLVSGWALKARDSLLAKN